jgi:hypothetical protein
LAFIDPLVLIPVLALLVGTGGGVRGKSSERMLLQGKVAVSPAGPAGLDQPLLNGRHLKRGERLAEGTLVVGKLGNLDRCVG